MESEIASTRDQEEMSPPKERSQLSFRNQRLLSQKYRVYEVTSPDGVLSEGQNNLQ